MQNQHNAQVVPIQTIQQKEQQQLPGGVQQTTMQQEKSSVSIQGQNEKQNTHKIFLIKNNKLRKCLKLTSSQLCLSILPCIILTIPLIAFIAQLITFVNTDLRLMRNEMVVNDIYFENLCDPSNMIMKLNVLQRWNATFDIYISQLEMLVHDENGENIFKFEMLMDETTSSDFVPPPSKRKLSGFGNSYIVYVPKQYEKDTGNSDKNPDVLDVTNLNSGILAFKFTSDNLQKLSSLLRNMKEDKHKSTQDKNIVSLKINAKMAVSRFQDLQFRVQFQTTKIEFPLSTRQSLKSKCEKCRSSRKAFEKINTPEYKARQKLIKEKRLKSRKSNFTINSIENMMFSPRNFLLGINGMQDNIYISGDSDFSSTLRISTGLNAQPVMDLGFSFFSIFNNQTNVLSEFRSKTIPSKILHNSKTISTHGAVGCKLNVNNKTHEKGIRETMNAIFQGTLHDELRKFFPVTISAVKDDTPNKKRCFLKTIMDSIDYNFAMDNMNGKKLLNKSITEMMEYIENADKENLCRIDPEDRSHCSMSETKYEEEKSERRRANVTGYRPAALDYLACVPKSIKMPASKCSTTTGVITIVWKSSSFKKCLRLVNRYEVMGIENTKAPILWIEEISSGFYAQFKLDYKVNEMTYLDIKIKFGNKITVNTVGSSNADDYTNSRIITSTFNGVPERYNWKLSGQEDNFILYRSISQILVDLYTESSTDAERSTAFCRLLPTGGTFQTLLGVGSSLMIPYEFTLRLPAIITGALPDVDFGDVSIHFFDPHGNVELGTLTVKGEWFYTFSTTRAKITYMFKLTKSPMNVENSTVVSRFWGRILSSTSVPVNIAVTHRNVHLKAHDINVPKGLLSQDCGNKAIPEMVGKTLFSNLMLVLADFKNNTDTSCYGKYDIQMNINNILSFPIVFAYPESHLGCVYLYRDLDGIKKSDVVSIGCGSYVQSSQIEQYESVKNVNFHIDNSKANEKKYLDLKRDITKNQMVKTTWGIDESNIKDGTDENECIKLRDDGTAVLQRQWKIAIIGKLAIKFDSVYTMQVDNIVYPSQEFIQPNYVENTTFKIQYEESSAAEENKKFKKIDLIDLDTLNDADKNFGDLDFNMSDYVDSNSYGFYIDGAGFFFLVFSAVLGCCSTCYSILAIISNCKMCPYYKRLIQDDEQDGYEAIQGTNSRAVQVVYNKEQVVISK